MADDDLIGVPVVGAKFGEACVTYDGTEFCDTTYGNRGESERRVYPPNDSDEEFPEEATVEFKDTEYDAELCFRPGPAFCWDVG